MGTVDALVEKYGIDPDVKELGGICKKYSEFFSQISAKYQKRYNKIIDKKK